jgi:hypothetical protein
LRVVQVIAVTLLIGNCATAEENLAEARKSEEYTPSPILRVSLPATPAPQKVEVINKKFLAVMGALGAAESMRFTTRTLVLEHEEAAGAPWVTSTPPHPQFVAKNALIFGAEMFVAYEIKKPHAWLPGDRTIRKFWWLYPAAMAGIHLSGAVHNIRTQAPAMCETSDCQLP